MSTVFAVLLLISIGFMLWGVIAPHHLSKFGKKPITRRDAGIGFGVISLVFFILTGVTAPRASLTPVATTPVTTAKVKSVSDTAKAKAKAATITTKTEVATEDIPFEATTVPSSTLEKGVTKVTTQGANGIKTLTYEVTLADGKETSKKLIKTEITTPPITQVTSIGTYVKPVPATPQPKMTCDPNYSGACVPIASDVDCGSGRGDGPAYVYGVVKVIGVDIYGLDRDHDGLGCE